MSFTDRNLIARAPSGPAIPTGARTSILSWFGAHGFSPTTIWETSLREEAFGAWGEIDDDIRSRFGDEEADVFAAEMTKHWEREKRRMAFAGGVNYDAEAALQAIPAPWFLNAVEYSLKRARYNLVDGVNEINRVCNKVGASYRFSFTGEAAWHGDAGIHDAVIRPALDALGDTRLAGCASEFNAALAHLRGGTAKDLEDAIEESGKSVESAMKVLLDERGVTRTGKEAAYALFGLLVGGGVCPAEAENAVLGVAKIRNNMGAHGTGASPRVVPSGVPELAVNTAASAIRYLADQLP
jgi:hypothetical protein